MYVFMENKKKHPRIIIKPNIPCYNSSGYGKCPKSLNILFNVLMACILLFMQSLLKILSGMPNGVDTNKTAAPSGAV